GHVTGSRLRIVHTVSGYPACPADPPCPCLLLETSSISYPCTALLFGPLSVQLVRRKSSRPWVGSTMRVFPDEDPLSAMALNPYDLFDVRSLLSEEERAVQDTVARFTDERVLPIIGDAFDQGRFPKELVPEIAELGLLGSSLPEEYGCAGLNGVSYGLICQGLERGDSGIRSFVSVQSSLCMYPIYAYGTEEQRKRWLPDMAAGKVIGCFGLTEPHGGSDPANMKTSAKRDGGDWVLNGS